MARPLRILFPGALYHVTARGNGRRSIYHDAHDRKRFLEILADVVRSHNVICHAYCLMGNHYHLLLETPDGNLTEAMRDLNGIYTQWSNYRHDTTGHLLQGRYNAFVIEKETYFLAVARYIVLNPVRAGLVHRPADWEWSSYRDTAGNQKKSHWLATDDVLLRFGKQKKSAQKAYAVFVAEGIDAASPFDEVKEGNLLGSPQFVASMWEITNGSEDVKEISRSERVVGRPTLNELFAGVKTKQERDAIIRIARFRCGYLQTEIGRFLGLDRSTIGKIVRERS